MNAEFETLLRDSQIEASYEDVSGQLRRASDDALVALLGVLGVEIRDPQEAREVVKARRQERRRRALEPVHVAWDGAARPVALTVPIAASTGAIIYKLDLGSECIERKLRIDELARDEDWEDETGNFAVRLLPLPNNLPWGYHTLHVELDGRKFSSTVISTPSTAFVHEATNGSPAREWGCFLPLYALRTERDWGVGDFTTLGELSSWIGQLGGSECATLPLLAAYLDQPLEVSPYRPVSRLFWNELYIDVEAVPEMKTWPDGRRLVGSTGFLKRIRLQRDSEFVDYVGVMRLKREVLEQLAARFFAERPSRFGEFQTFLSGNPELKDYARFRAAVEQKRRPWADWPERIKNGHLDEIDYNVAAVNYHLYVQWIVSEQLAKLRSEAERAGGGLYLDLPVGVDPGGYDMWRYGNEFVRGASVGAPADIVFTHGQDWGLPPLHPERIRASGYSLFRRVIATNMRFARRLRIDHVPGLHRLYCIPPGYGADQGAYVRYRADELYAVAILESHRHRCELVGENLGTVPPEVDEKIAAHGISGMWVAPYELEAGRRRVLSPPPAQHVAMLNTHDMPPLAAWWRGEDIDLRLELGLVDAAGADNERAERREATKKLAAWLRAGGRPTLEGDELANGDVPLRPLLRSIAASPAHLVLINVEDLWLETRPQNVPGDFKNQPNWRRKARYRLEQFRELHQVLETLAEVDALRKNEEQLK